MTQPVQVVEPTLVDQTGHCHSFVSAVCGARSDQRFVVWAGRAAAANLLGALPQVELRPYFSRRIRRLQALLLYRRLLRAGERTFVPTAGTTEISLASLAARGLAQPKAALFVHWLRGTDSQRRRLAAAARRQPELHLLAPTDAIADVLRAAGFRRVERVAYPLSPQARPKSEPGPFRHLLFAGAARLDKGFPRVVDLVERLAREGEQLPLCIQTSPRHYEKHDAPIGRELARLERCAYAGLRSHPATLESAAYFALFDGAICLQPYDRSEFAGRVSAVTVDALACGAPIITTAGTWMGVQVERFEAGLALEDPSGQALHGAVRTLLADYARYSANARRAARAIEREHDPARLLAAVLAAPAPRA
jgi:glycosyltransferase involved in cell wall biosynthesis